MRADLAENLLGRVMDWDEYELSRERFNIQMLAEVKYDDYEQYSQGMKYIESLALWLNQFSGEDRKAIYHFVTNNMIFISQVQIRQIVDMLFSFFVKPRLVERVREICIDSGKESIGDKKLVYRQVLRRTLFLGLSDGSHIDYFRRCNAFLSNEQIGVHYDISESKVADLKQELVSDLKKTMGEEAPINDQFAYFCLLDDFSASGISYIRKENDIWKGKICKFIESMVEHNLNQNGANICVFIYLATRKAIEYINERLQTYVTENERNIKIEAIAIQYIPCVKPDQHIEFLLKKYYDYFQMNVIEDKHYKKGKCDHPYLGFDECSLPVVLSHNTPNNSFPLIWYNSDQNYRGLFPRVMRHKEGNQ